MKKIFLLAFFIPSFVLAAGEFSPSIIGGIELNATSVLAKQTIFIRGKMYRASFSCTGVIFSKDLILTAGHCLGGTGYADLTVHFGTKKDDAGPDIKVVKQLRMRDAIPDSPFNWDDIALLRLAQSIPADYEPATVLADTNLLRDQADVVLAGYGRTNPLPNPINDEGVGILRAVDQKILQAAYTSTEILVDDHNKGACSGDSGGPAFMKVGNDYFLIGITSRMTENDRLPNEGQQKRYGCIVDMVYSNVLAQHEWIAKTAKELMK